MAKLNVKNPAARTVSNINTSIQAKLSRQSIAEAGTTRSDQA